MQYIKASELFPKKIPWIEGGLASSSDPPFPLLPGEDILYEVRRCQFILNCIVNINFLGPHR